MNRFYACVLRPQTRGSRISLFRSGLFLTLVSAALFVATAVCAHAQYGAMSGGTHVRDASALRPPAGARVAIVEFADLECPDCAQANPLLKEAVEKYHIPWVRHDFPLPYHAWSFNAAVNARWFDLKSKKIGDEYRDEVFQNQTYMYSLNDLRVFTDKFAAAHGIAMPFAVDPQGKLTDEVKADYALGQRIGIDHTPTIWVVTSSSKGVPFVEVLDRSKLFQMIDQAIAETTPARAHR
jgi:protein-disulfide isomerase